MTGTRIFSIGIALTFLGSAASAQNLSDYVLSGAAAERAVTRVEINAATAEALVDSCIAHARDNDVSVSVFVLSPSGTIVHAQRMDGQTPINTETALYKAETALYMRAPTSVVAERFSDPLARITRVAKIDWYLVPGGLPIIVDGQLIGSIGVGGAAGGFDERCAYHALGEVLGQQPPAGN